MLINKPIILLVRLFHISCLSLSLLLISAASSTVIHAETVDPDKVKAAYIYQFINFASWPDITEIEVTIFNICIFGNDPIIDELNPLNESHVGNYMIKINILNSQDNYTACKILYISSSVQSNLNNILKHINNKPVLTVSSLSDFVLNGGMIGFILLDNKIRLEINYAHARRSNIILNAKLLEVANLVINHSPGNETP